jgi:hypothetical protein
VRDCPTCIPSLLKLPAVQDMSQPSFLNVLQHVHAVLTDDHRISPRVSLLLELPQARDIDAVQLFDLLSVSQHPQYSELVTRLLR